MTTQELDAIFNGAGAVVTGLQTVTNAVGASINEVQNAFDGSRRNTLSTGYPTGHGYQPLPSYGYGYEDNQYPQYGYPYPSMMGGMNPNQNGFDYGYQGFTNPMYGTGCGSYQPTTGSYLPFDGPKGGAWGW